MTQTFSSFRINVFISLPKKPSPNPNSQGTKAPREDAGAVQPDNIVCKLLGQKFPQESMPIFKQPALCLSPLPRWHWKSRSKEKEKDLFFFQMSVIILQSKGASVGLYHHERTTLTWTPFQRNSSSRRTYCTSSCSQTIPASLQIFRKHESNATKTGIWIFPVAFCQDIKLHF